MADNGAYNIGLFIGTSISIPVAAITSISAPLVSEWWKQNDITEISNLYTKSSINLLVVGVGLFVLILVSLNDLISILPQRNEFDSLYQIVMFLGFARIIDMSLGIKHQIILYSPRYRFALYTILALATSNVLANLFFIRILSLGMIGAAMATCISFLLINIVYYVFIYAKFSMQPFNWSTLKVITVGLILFYFGHLLKISDLPILNLVFKSLLIGPIYLCVIYVLNVSSDINRTISKMSEKVLHLFLRK